MDELEEDGEEDEDEGDDAQYPTRGDPHFAGGVVAPFHPVRLQETVAPEAPSELVTFQPVRRGHRDDQHHTRDDEEKKADCLLEFECLAVVCDVLVIVVCDMIVVVV